MSGNKTHKTLRSQRVSAINWKPNLPTDAPPVPSFKKVLPDTERAYARQLALYKEFVSDYQKLEVKVSLLDPLPSIESIKDWIRWTAISTRGRLGTHITKCTMRNYWVFLVEALFRATSFRFPRAFRTEINNFIQQDLDIRDETGNQILLTINKKSKPIFIASDLRVLLEHLWTEDYYFRNDRYRVQLALGLQILMYSASRPGAIVESPCHRGTNELPLYEHFRVGLIVLEGEKKARLVFGLTIHYMKGMRSKEAYSPTISLHETPQEFGLGMEPTILLLALAFADKAFADDLTPEGLLNIEKQHTGGITWLKWKQDILKTPVFRHCKRGTALSGTQGMSYAAFRREFVRVQIACGYLETVTPYAIRRGAANILHDNISDGQLRQVMNHRKEGTFEEYYLAKTPFVDCQSIILGLPQQKALVLQMQQAPKRKRGVLHGIGPDGIQRIEDDLDLSDLVDKQDEMRRVLKREHTNICDAPPEDQRCYQKIRSQVKWVRLKLQKAELKTLNENESEGQPTRSRLPNKSPPRDKLYLQRKKLASEMFGYPETADRLGALRSLIDLCVSSGPPAKHGASSSGFEGQDLG